MYHAPHEAILLMMEEINKRQYNSPELEEPTNDHEVNNSNPAKGKEKGFDVHLKQLRDIKKSW